LKNAFEKYLPAVISETKGVKKASNLTEQTGNKTAKVVEKADIDSNVIDIKRLAGL
jgi:hypothetical protein